MNKNITMPRIKPDVRERGEAILRKIDHLDAPVVAEVGVFAGALSAFLCFCRPQMSLLMVDNWLPEAEQPEHYRKTDDYSSKLDSQEVSRLEGVARSVEAFFAGAQILKGDSGLIGAQQPDGIFDLVFLDADHSYEGMQKDLISWLPTVKSGGWIGGHDYQNDSDKFDFSGNVRAVNEFVADVGLPLERGPNFTWFVKIP